jgi:hypothetical protein
MQSKIVPTFSPCFTVGGYVTRWHPARKVSFVNCCSESPVEGSQLGLILYLKAARGVLEEHHDGAEVRVLRDARGSSVSEFGGGIAW